MKLRRAFVLGCVFGFVSSVSVSSFASAQGQPNHEIPYNQVQSIWNSLDSAQKKVVDLVAADFFHKELSAAQQNRIVASQAEKYRNGSPQIRNSMRHERRNEWQLKSLSERQAALLSTGGTYSVLTEQQKAPFRLYAIDKLEIKPAPPSGISARGSAI